MTKVIGHAPCNVLIVPRKANIECKTVLVATDGSDHSVAETSAAISMASQCGGELTAISVVERTGEEVEAKANVNNVVEMAQREGMAVKTLTPTGRSHEAIAEAAGGMGADLIVMGALGKTLLKRFFVGSTTEKVVGSAGCAVLVVNAS